MTVQVSDRTGPNLHDGVTKQPSARVRSMKRDAVRSKARTSGRAWSAILRSRHDRWRDGSDDGDFEGRLAARRCLVVGSVAPDQLANRTIGFVVFGSV